MTNYIKSELYRVGRSNTLYVMTAVLAGLTLLFNIALFALNQYDASFRYATARFSLNMLTGSLGYLFVAGASVIMLLYADDKKNGTFKNSIAYGIPRASIFLGKIIVSVVSATVSAAAVLVVYIGGAYLLLDTAGAGEALVKLLEGFGAAYLSIVAYMALAALLLNLMNSTVVAVICWYVITYSVPPLCIMLAGRFPLFDTVSDWLPANFFKFEVLVTMDSYDCLWNTPEGLTKCIAAGIGFAVIFMAAGLFVCRKKEA